MKEMLKDSVYACSDSDKQSRVIAARLVAYVDLLSAIEELCTEYKFKAAFISTCFGSLASARYEVIAEDKNNNLGAKLSDPIKKEGPLQLLNAQGTVSFDEEQGQVVAHVHGAFIDKQSNVHGGHLLRNECPVLRTMEIIIQEINDIEMYRRYNPKTESVQLLIEDIK